MARKPAAPPAVDPTSVRSRLGYLGEDEICAALKIEPLTLRNRLSRGTAPPSYKVGNEHLFDVKEFHAWVRRKRFTGGQAA